MGFGAVMMTVQIDRTHRVPVQSLSDASKVVRAHIEDASRGPWMGSSEWYGKLRTAKGAAVRDDGKTIAYVSYNGRLWTPTGVAIEPLRAIRWCFDDGKTFEGYTDDTTWNGFTNVWVTPETHAAVLAHLHATGEDDPDMDALSPLTCCVGSAAYGLVSYTNGYATQEVAEDEAHEDTCQTCIARREEP